jgi:peptidoglycan-associated lipoprotein
MFNKLILSLFIIFFVAACATKPKDAGEASGTGSSASDSETVSSSSAGELTSVDYTADVPSDYEGIYPGSQEDLIVNVGDRIFFAYDSYELDSDAQELLQDQAAWLKQYNKTSINIEGHCDERGTREYNLALGEKRAQAVKNYLNALGVAKSSLNTISYGKERPAVIGSNDGAWSQNRRAVTIVN